MKGKLRYYAWQAKVVQWKKGIKTVVFVNRLNGEVYVFEIEETERICDCRRKHDLGERVLLTNDKQKHINITWKPEKVTIEEESESTKRTDGDAFPTFSMRRKRRRYFDKR